MAENKKGFILYCDLIHTINSLDDNEAGQLLKHLLAYVNDLSPTAPSRVIQLVFEPIKQQLKRDLREWEQTRCYRVESGKKGGINSGKARLKQKEANEASASKSKQTKQSQANEAVKVTVNVTDKVIVKDTVTHEEESANEIFRKFAHLSITYAEIDKLLGFGYEMSQIGATMDAIENYAKNKNYKSLFLTTKKWLEKDNLNKNGKPKTIPGTRITADTFARINSLDTNIDKL